MAQTYTILGLTEFGVPSGNYDGSSLDWTSNPVQAADYYRGRGSSTQTVTFRLDNFVGRIVVEATLDSDADNATWFNTFEIGDSAALTDYHPVTIPGNFTWMRVRVEFFDAGIIQFITITY